MHEGIIDRADGKQPLAEQAVRQACSAQKQEQVHLGDAQFDMLAFGREFPFRGGWNAVFDEGVGLRLPGEQLAAVDPGAQVRGPRDIG